MNAGAPPLTAQPIERVAVVGAGVIGVSWAAYFAAHGCDVVVTDPDPGAHAAFESILAPQWEQLTALGLAPGAARERIRFEPLLERAVADAQFVQENGPERIAIKQRIFEQLDRWTGPDALLVTSSSGLLVSDIQTVCRHPERVLLGHPFNPPHLIPLVEVVGGSRTAASAIARTLAFYRAIGKMPIHLKREVPGHVANRLQAAMQLEVYRLLDEGLVTPKDIDDSVLHGLALRIPILGIMAKADFTGLLLMQQGIKNRSYTPPVPRDRSETLDALIEAGRTGVMAGKGYFDWGDRSPEELFQERDRKLLALKQALRAIGPMEPK